MSPRIVILPSVFASVESKPLDSLKRYMLAKADMWRCPNEPTDIESYLGLSRTEVENEICGIWMLMFRSKEALNTGLSVLINYDNKSVLADFCKYYSQVLIEMEIEVIR